MNWGRAKTILIIMFLVTDIFLLVVLLQTKLVFTRLPEQTVAETVRILQNNGLDIESSVIPRRRAENRNIIMRNAFEEPAAAADRMLGSFETRKADKLQHEYHFVGEQASLFVSNVGFTYRRTKEPKPYRVGEEPTVEALQSKISDQLGRLGFNRKETSIDGGRLENGLYHCQAVPLYQGVKIYGISMHITADSEDILSLEGSWFRAVEAEVYAQEPLLDITAVLTGLIYREDCRNMRIMQIENAFYAADDYLSSREIAAVPVYTVTDSAQRRLFFDARVGNMIE
ncbi:MAG: hypothetical protein ACI4QW_00955 [Clostridia bacterium]